MDEQPLAPSKPQVTTDRRSWLGLVVLILAVGAAAHWAHERLDREAGQRLRAAALAPGELTMLVREDCVYCRRAAQWLSAEGIPFTACDVERDAACGQQFAALHAPGTPVFLLRGRVQLGWSPQGLAELLKPVP